MMGPVHVAARDGLSSLRPRCGRPAGRKPPGSALPSASSTCPVTAGGGDNAERKGHGATGCENMLRTSATKEPRRNSVFATTKTGVQPEPEPGCPAARALLAIPTADASCPSANKRWHQSYGGSQGESQQVLANAC